MVDEAWEVYKRMATLEDGALLVGVSGGSAESGCHKLSEIIFDDVAEKDA